jgi:hypothetical protein
MDICGVVTEFAEAGVVRPVVTVMAIVDPAETA